VVEKFKILDAGKNRDNSFGKLILKAYYDFVTESYRKFFESRLKAPCEQDIRYS
jgi:hypothetical protein